MSNKGFHVSGVAETRKECRIARDERSETRSRLFQVSFTKKKWFLRNIEFACQLYRGKSIYPKTEKLTCLDMGLKNKKLIQDFIKRLDEDESSVLWSWKIIDLDGFKKARNKHLFN